MVKALLAALSFSLFSSVSAFPQATAVGNFEGASDENLATVRAEIASMKEPQLRALLAYLAECRGRSTAPLAVHACASARARYEIEFGGQRAPAVDRAINSAEHLLLVTRTIGKVDSPPGTVKIETTMTDSVRAALQRVSGSR